MRTVTFPVERREEVTVSGGRRATLSLGGATEVSTRGEERNTTYTPWEKRGDTCPCRETSSVLGRSERNPMVARNKNVRCPVERVG